MNFKYINELNLSKEKSNLIYDEISKYINEKIKEEVTLIKKDYEKQIENLQLDVILEKELALNGARNVKSVVALIDKEKLYLKNGEIPFLKQKIQELKNNPNTSFLFFNDENCGFRGVTPFESTLRSSKKVEKMDYEELCQYYNDYLNI